MTEKVGDIQAQIENYQIAMCHKCMVETWCPVDYRYKIVEPQKVPCGSISFDLRVFGKIKSHQNYFKPDHAKPGKPCDSNADYIIKRGK